MKPVCKDVPSEFIQTGVCVQAVSNEVGLAESNEFRRGWRILLASMLGIGCGLAAMPFYTAGVFAPHLAREFGWSMGEIMAGLTITTVMVVIAAPVTGMLCEKYGTRKIALASLISFGLSYFLLAVSSGSLIQFYLTWAVAATLGAGTLPITFTRTVNRWFDKHRGLALGLAMTGTGLFGILCKPLLAWVIADFGWRGGYFALGLLPLCLALPVAFALLKDPATTSATGMAEPADESTISGMTRGEAVRHWRFWLIGAILVPISFALAGAIPNLEPILLDRGIDQATILTLTPLVGLASIGGRLIGGWLLDRFWAPGVAFILLGMPAISCALLTSANLDPNLAGLAIVLIGFALGIEYDVVAYLTSRYFGMRSYAAIYGIFYVCFSTGAGFGPLVFGLIRDFTQDFGPALKTSAVILPLCSAGFLFLGKYRYKSTI